MFEPRSFFPDFADFRFGQSLMEQKCVILNASVYLFIDPRRFGDGRRDKINRFLFGEFLADEPAVGSDPLVIWRLNDKSRLDFQLFIYCLFILNKALDRRKQALRRQYGIERRT